MFKAVMKSKELCMSVLEAILDEPIHDIKYLGEELSLKAGYESKGVRLDVYVEDEAHTVYDVEMQVGSETDEELAKRMRYYQSQMDADHLARGKDYVELKKTIIIFICPFDPYKRGWHLYCFENTCCRDATLKLGDDTVGLSIVLCKFFSQPCRTYASRPTCAHPFRVGYAHSTIRESSGCSISRRVPARADRAA